MTGFTNSSEDKKEQESRERMARRVIWQRYFRRRLRRGPWSFGDPREADRANGLYRFVIK